MEENLFSHPQLGGNWAADNGAPGNSKEGVVSRESSEGATDFLKELTSPSCPTQGQRAGHHRVTADRQLSHAQHCRGREQAILNSAKLISKGGI